MRVAVIGGGASGLMCAGFLSLNGNDVDLFESNEKLGKKLFITGKGRCNVTNYCEPNEVLNNVVTNSKFLYSSLYSFTSEDTINFFENLGVPIKIERGNRAFPASDKSSDIIKALERFLIKNDVNIYLNNKVIKIEKNNDLFNITTTCGTYNSYDATIICTGGKTYSATGSSGDGYNFARKFGHTITDICPGLVPLILDDNFVKSIEGLSLKNVKLIAKIGNKIIKELFGEMLFTSNGVSGPIALSMSSYINKLKDIKLSIDFKPALSHEQLISRIKRDIDDNRNSQVSTLIAGLLPKALVPIVLGKLHYDATTKNKSLNDVQIKSIANLLKDFTLNYKGLDKLDFGIITSGGVNVKEVNPKTMESKIVPGLYFAGEVLDVDALTGGYNLQIAFSTAYTVANSIK